MTRQTASNIAAFTGGMLMLLSIVFLHDDQVGLAAGMVVVGAMLGALSAWLD